MSAVTEHSDTWFTQDVVVPDQLKLRRYSSSSSKSSGDSSTSSLELEVSRLAQALRRITAPCNITAVDYSRSRARFYSDLDGSNLPSFLAAGRPGWSAVRWIVVDGVSGDVLQTLAEHYDLHPLAIEDVINFQRIKCISYPGHISAFNYRPTRSVMRRRRLMMQQVSMFLHSTGVLITIFPGRAAGGGSAAAKIAGPIMRGIRGMSSLLLESEDAGFLLQALLRSCMSYSLPVFGRLADVLSRLDARVLEGRAAMKLTRRLHVLLIDLSILARSFQPMESLLQALATSSSSIHHIWPGGPAAAGNRTLRGSSSSSSSSSSDTDKDDRDDLLDQAVAVTGDLSAMADHVTRLNELVVTTVGHANNNANLTLALLGTIFLPLTWIAGIYGMNFDDLPELHWRFGYPYFYLLSAGVVVLALLLMVHMRLIKVKEPDWLRSVRHALKRLKRRLLPGRHAYGLHFMLGSTASAAGRRKKAN
ncbi:hypothetical protein OEZ85_007465 [Tetradesmus obliquus]|uniref:Magnesium transporter n=1 Tax=Tetradesmus obliquus TaxID=3088 RepID=A0ABY8TFZ6_TETOB|nr:hypothetical protein OEZ85_007465 [Tetradesmus obliquus]